MSRYLYAAFVTLPGADGQPRARWTVTRSKRRAIAIARQYDGYVGCVARDALRGGLRYGLDAPTFRAQMDLIADYRPTAPAPLAK